MAYRFTPWRALLECAATAPRPSRSPPAPPLSATPANGKTKERIRDRP
jgi:hypothetical protein